MGNSLVIVNCKSHGERECEHCPKYPEEIVLPDEDGMCSLCGKHEAEKGERQKGERCEHNFHATATGGNRCIKCGQFNRN